MKHIVCCLCRCNITKTQSIVNLVWWDGIRTINSNLWAHLYCAEVEGNVPHKYKTTNPTTKLLKADTVVKEALAAWR